MNKRSHEKLSWKWAKEQAENKRKICIARHAHLHHLGSAVKWKIKRRQTQTKRETHMKGEFDACLVIQVAENDFTSSNLRLCTRLSSYVATLLPHSERNVGYIKSSLWWNSDAKGKTISFGETETWAESGFGVYMAVNFSGRAWLRSC